MAGTLLPFFFLLPYPKPSDQVTKERAETEAGAVHGGLCSQSKEGAAGAESWHLENLSSLKAEVPGPAPPV